MRPFWPIVRGHDNEKKLDAHDRKALYKVLTKEVLPTYYRNHKKWVKMMQTSIRSTQEPFAVKRMLEEYYEHLYKG